MKENYKLGEIDPHLCHVLRPVHSFVEMRTRAKAGLYK